MEAELELARGVGGSRVDRALPAPARRARGRRRRGAPARGGRAAVAARRPARARARARGPRRPAAPHAAPDRGARAAAPGARAGRGLRLPAARRAGPLRALRDRRAAATTALGGVELAHRARAARRRRWPPTASTNREIAQALFVTPKTVEVHLSNAYRKLDIRSRRELAGALADPSAAGGGCRRRPRRPAGERAEALRLGAVRLRGRPRDFVTSLRASARSSADSSSQPAWSIRKRTAARRRTPATGSLRAGRRRRGSGIANRLQRSHELASASQPHSITRPGAAPTARGRPPTAGRAAVLAWCQYG